VERFVREYAGRVDFLYVVHRHLDRLARVRMQLQGGVLSYDTGALLEYVNGVEALCALLPQQLREECLCPAVVAAFYSIRRIIARSKQFEEEHCEGVYEKLEEVEQLLKKLEEEERKREAAARRAQAGADKLAPVSRSSTYPSPTLSGALLSSSSSPSIEEVRKRVEELRGRARRCEEVEEEMEALWEKVEEAAGRLGAQFDEEDRGFYPYAVIRLADAALTRIVDALDARGLLISGRRVSVGVARVEAGGAGQAGVEE